MIHLDQQFFGFGDRQRLARATLDQQTQQGMQPTDRASPVGGDLMVTIGQQAQHHPVFIETGDNVQQRVVPRNDRCRAGVVGVGLVDPAALEQPHS